LEPQVLEASHRLGESLPHLRQEKLFHFYQFHQDEFLAHYRKRSNVESTFAMIKAKFGDPHPQPHGHGDE
jgi:hypothetical protein